MVNLTVQTDLLYNGVEGISPFVFDLQRGRQVGNTKRIDIVGEEPRVGVVNPCVSVDIPMVSVVHTTGSCERARSRNNGRAVSAQFLSEMREHKGSTGQIVEYSWRSCCFTPVARFSRVTGGDDPRDVANGFSDMNCRTNLFYDIWSLVRLATPRHHLQCEPGSCSLLLPGGTRACHGHI